MNNTARKLNTATIVNFPSRLTDRQVENRIAQYAQLDAQIKELKKQADALKAEIIDNINGAFAGKRYTAKYTEYTSPRIDSTRLKAERPDVYAEYIKETISSKFTYKAI